MRSVRHFHGGRAEGGERRKFPRSSTRRSFSRRENSIPSTSVVVDYIYPDGLIAVEVFRVIGAAMRRGSPKNLAGYRWFESISLDLPV